MVTKFSASGGSENEVISVDPEEIMAILGNVDFTINVSRGTYAAETRISNYINTLFEVYEDACSEWESARDVANQYTKEVDNVPDPVDPIDTDVFDEIEVVETDSPKEKNSSNNESNKTLSSSENMEKAPSKVESGKTREEFSQERN